MHRELLRAIVSVKVGISFYKVDLKALDKAYSIAFPESTPINVNKKKSDVAVVAVLQFKKEDNMAQVEINKQARLSQHFTLGELCKTSAKTADGNIPSHVHIENLKRLCGWLEELRRRWNNIYGEGDDPIIINSGYRSEAVNKAVGGVPSSNHLTGCAVDIHVYGIEQLVRYATILLDISDERQEDFDELLLERSPRGTYWLHFAVRPTGNRRRIRLIQT
jgi:uncharacterized protein YcbK (DUF882 family)